VTLFFALRGEHTWSAFLPYVIAQFVGALLGVWAAHMMFDMSILQVSDTMHRTGLAQWSSEIIATFGLLFVIVGGVVHKPDTVPPLVGLYITGAYWFTSSTSFANPAVTFARGWSDTFAGIAPQHIGMFVVMQLIGVGVAYLVLPLVFSKVD
jgi:glycerol uptake facilitator-like aquaporin